MTPESDHPRANDDPADLRAAEPFAANLSPAGEQRRRAILRAAVAAAGRRRLQRRVRRGAAGSVLLAIVAVGAARFVETKWPGSDHPGDPSRLVQLPPEFRATVPVQTPSGQTARPRTEVPPTPAGERLLRPATRPAEKVPTPLIVVRRPPPRPVTITTIPTDPGLADALAAPRTADGVERVGTDGLLRALDQGGMSGGVVVRGGKPQLWLAAPVAAVGQGG